MKVTDEMVEAFGNRFWLVNAASKVDAERENIRAALEASINSSNQVDDGGPAYPGVLGPPSEFSTGISKRDYFAAKAMAGDFAAQNKFCGEIATHAPYEWMLVRAKMFYRMADAMIAARSE